MVVGIDFRTAGLAMRNRFWVGQSRLRPTLAYLSDSEGIEEAIVLSTCERTEFLIWANDAALAANSVLRLLSSQYGLQLCEWKHFHRLLDEGALTHLFRVAGGLDSAIIGDRQILSPLKRAWQEARLSGSCAKYLDAVLQKACSLADRVHSETGLGRAGVSVASAAVEMAKEMLGSLESKTVVLVGTGMLGELAANYLTNQGVFSLRILNRTFEPAVQLAQRVGGTAVPLEDLPHEIAKADVAIGCATSPEPLLSVEAVARVVHERKGQNLCILDLGFPCNFESAVRELSGIFLYDLDDVQKAILRSTDRQQKSLAEIAEHIVDTEAKQFHHHLAGEHIIPMITAIRERLDQLCGDELEGFRRECGPFPKNQDQLLARLTCRITQRLAAALAREVKEHPEKSEQEHMTEAVHRLFHLESESELVSNKQDTH